jgi:ElaA protein
VFVVEQNCIFQDADDKDQKCFHLLGKIEATLAAYARLVPKQVSYPDHISIGRIVSSPLFRNQGVGKLLLEKAIEESYRLFGQQDIKIGAQFHLNKFYEGFGFKQTSEVYDEDGIAHIEMVKNAFLEKTL